MNNGTTDISPAINIFRRYLLGDTLKNSLIRLTVILSAIIIVWSGIVIALIIHMKCQRKKQMLKTSNTHHHLYDSNSSLTRKRSNSSKRNRRFNSSSSSLSSSCCYSIRRVFSQLKQHCIFWPLSTSHRPTSAKKPKEVSSITPNRVQLVVETMGNQPSKPIHRPINIGKKISLYRETDSSSGDELRNFTPIENKSNIIPKTSIHHPAISLPIHGNKDEHHQTTKRLLKIDQFNTKATSFFRPITRRLSNTNTNSRFPPINTIQKQQQNKPLLMISSARELASDNEWILQHSIIDEPTITDGSRTSSSRHIPLVMITDTSSSNTNIVELETFDDGYRLVGDVERRLSRELRASYRPRHST
jgi:hypothetical protein